MNLTRWTGRILVLFSLYRVARLLYGGIPGKITIVVSRQGTPTTWTRPENPERFRDAMAVEWLNGLPFLLGGSIISGSCRWADRMDPFSPEFAAGAGDETFGEESAPRE
jgi:hypothetical protein